MSKLPLFNPLDKRNLGRSVVDALLERPVHPLANTPQFSGAGIYAIYYKGAYAAYAPLAALNRKSAVFPIYIGKAVPQGARKGAMQDASSGSNALIKRLREHADSITAAGSLRLEDFFCRYLTVDDIWIPLGETLLIQRYEPLWNQAVEGFGNHNPGKGRHQGKRPLWDELHPGRAWAAKCAPSKHSVSEIEKMVSDYMVTRLPSLVQNG